VGLFCRSAQEHLSLASLAGAPFSFDEAGVVKCACSKPGVL
jgi:hypothetical protein